MGRLGWRDDPRARIPGAGPSLSDRRETRREGAPCTTQPFVFSFFRIHCFPSDRTSVARVSRRRRSPDVSSIRMAGPLPGARVLIWAKALPLQSVTTKEDGHFAIVSPATRAPYASRGDGRVPRGGREHRRAVRASRHRHDHAGRQRALRIGRRLGVAGRDSAHAGHLERHRNQRRGARDDASSTPSAMRCARFPAWPSSARAALGAQHRRLPARRRIELHARARRRGPGQCVRRRLRLRPGHDDKHRANRDCPGPSERALRIECDRLRRQDRDPARRSAFGRAQRRDRSATARRGSRRLPPVSGAPSSGVVCSISSSATG